MDATNLFLYPLGLRLLIMAATVAITFWCTRREFQWGLLLCILSGIGIFELVKPAGFLPILSIDRIVWPIVFGFFLWRRQRGETERLPLDAVEWSMLSFAAAALLSFLVHGLSAREIHGQARLEISPLLRGIIMPYATYVIARRAIRAPAQVQSFLKGLGGVAVYLTIVGVGESWGLPWLVFPRDILNPNIGIHYGQARGIFLNASHNGVAIAMALPVLIWLFFTDRSRLVGLWLLTAGLSLVPLAYTIQRAVWLGTACAILVLALAWPRRRSFLFVTLTAGACSAFLLVSEELAKRMDHKVQDVGSVDYRINLLNTSLKLIQEHPFLGIGFNRFQTEIYGRNVSFVRPEDIYSHNTPLTILTELGIVGLAPYVSVLVALLAKSLKLYLRSPAYRGILATLWAVSTTLILMMQAGEYRVVLYPNALFFCLWGMIPEVVRRQTDKSTQFEQPASRPASSAWASGVAPTPVWR